MSEKDLHSFHEMVAAMQDELRNSDIDDYAWSSWRVLKSVPVADREDKIELLVCPTKRRSATDGHLYYSVESVIDYAGDALGEVTWSDTEDCEDASLLKVLRSLADENTDEEIRALYREHVLAGGGGSRVRFETEGTKWQQWQIFSRMKWRSSSRRTTKTA